MLRIRLRRVIRSLYIYTFLGMIRHGGPTRSKING